MAAPARNLFIIIFPGDVGTIFFLLGLKVRPQNTGGLGCTGTILDIGEPIQDTVYGDVRQTYSERSYYYSQREESVGLPIVQSKCQNRKLLVVVAGPSTKSANQLEYGTSQKMTEKEQEVHDETCSYSRDKLCPQSNPHRIGQTIEILVQSSERGGPYEWLQQNSR